MVVQLLLSTGCEGLKQGGDTYEHCLSLFEMGMHARQRGRRLSACLVRRLTEAISQGRRVTGLEISRRRTSATCRVDRQVDASACSVPEAAGQRNRRGRCC